MPKMDKAHETGESQMVPRAKILAVDDEPRFLELVSHILTDEGHEVETVDNGNDALEKIKSKKYSLLLTGVRMPYMNGFELYEHIQKIAPSLAEKTIVVSGSVTQADTQEFLTKNKLLYSQTLRCGAIKKRGKAGIGRYWLDHRT